VTIEKSTGRQKQSGCGDNSGIYEYTCVYMSDVFMMDAIIDN
jgi:hypothetical protein